MRLEGVVLNQLSTQTLPFYFISDLFNDAVSSSAYIASNGRMSSE
jgi:surface polysaccharide O-acyltransferase-like enzyme